MAGPLMQARRVVGFKHETTPGTPISVAAADAQFNCYGTEANAEIGFVERDGQSGMSPLTGVPSARPGRFRFNIHCIGGSTAPAVCATLLPICGMGNTSGTFAFDSRPPAAASATSKNGSGAVWEDGRKKLIYGAAGNAELVCVAGEPAMFEFDIQGVWNGVSDDALPSVTFPTTAPIRSAATGLTIGSFTPVWRELRINFGNEVEARFDGGSGQPAIHSFVISRRRVTGSIEIESKLVADYDPFGDWIARTERALSFDLGTSGNRLSVDAPKLQITNIRDGNRGGVKTDIIEFQLSRSAAEGDELVIVSD